MRVENVRLQPAGHQQPSRDPLGRESAGRAAEGVPGVSPPALEPAFSGEALGSMRHAAFKMLFFFFWQKMDLNL